MGWTNYSKKKILMLFSLEKLYTYSGAKIGEDIVTVMPELVTVYFGGESHSIANFQRGNAVSFGYCQIDNHLKL